ncbi:hypothetical protein DFJ63DRAFT_95918 [Scheffersomyces coipomensis]|uniref:uncharacterized protein n=1 Tax=Scheffersomyces coipomensis TaxID=1788519 RepID=UPI00315C7848
MFGVSSVAIGLFTITSVATFVGFTFIVVPGLMLAAITGASAYLVYTITGANQSNNPKFEVLQQELTEKLRGATKKKSNNGIYEVLDQTGETNIGNEDDEDNLSGSVVRSSDVVDDEDVSPSPLIA